MSRRRPPDAAPPPIDALTLALWLATALVAGAVIMALEMLGFRLYAPYFGYSIYVWGSMICVVLGSLAAGYAAGGWLADRSQTDRPLYWLMLASALYQLVVVLGVRALLPSLAGLGSLTGTVLATLAVFAPPMMLLATAGPFLIRLLARSGRVGVAAGGISAMSTIGSILGVVITTFHLLPSIGTQATLVTACVATGALGACGMARARSLAAVAGLVPLLAVPLGCGVDWPDDTLWVSESPYNLVRVAGRGPRRALILNEAGSIHSVSSRPGRWTGLYYDDFFMGPLLVAGRRVLVLGAGGGGSIVATRKAAPEATFDAVEIDPDVIEAGRRYFHLQEGERLRVHLADARPWLARDTGQYDIVHVDLYQGGPYIPFYLLTREFFALLRERMSDDAVVMLNLYDVHPDHRLLDSCAATLKEVFPSLAVLSRPGGNHMLLAFTRERAVGELRSRLAQLGGPESVAEAGRVAAGQVRALEPPAEAPVFTDDHAPVESMIREMLIYYRQEKARREAR